MLSDDVRTVLDESILAPTTSAFLGLMNTFAGLMMSFVCGLIPVFVFAAFTAVLLAIAAPPIPGAALMVYTILFAQLGIPKEGLLLAAAMDLIIDYINTGFNVLFLLIETVDSAGRLGRLNRERLCRQTTT